MTAGRPIVAISEGFADYGDYYGFGYGRPLLAAGALPVLLPYYEDETDRVALLRTRGRPGARRRKGYRATQIRPRGPASAPR